MVHQRPIISLSPRTLIFNKVQSGHRQTRQLDLTSNGFSRLNRLSLPGLLMSALVWLGVYFGSAGAAYADLRVCNQSTNPVSVALGYRSESGWKSEGWWIAAPDDCTTVYLGNLDARYYYLFAADDISGGSWDGDVFMCSQNESFTIFGVEDCLARGYERTGFFEIDTDDNMSWTVQLKESDQTSLEE